jgi:hypothetical protein
MNLLDLAKKLEKMSAELEENVTKLSNKVALTLVRELASRTPVDTSQALSNWQVSLNEPISESEKISPWYHGQAGSTQAQSIRATVNESKRIIERRKPGDSIYISNVLPYIKRLDEGHSQTQAPNGFVDSCLLIARLYLKNSKINLVE